jgi:hypothetical protein
VTQQVPWLAQAARMTDFPVVEVDGWRSRGHGGMDTLEGVVLHHTAGPASGDYPSLRVVRDGRPGLAGPLAQLGLARSGTIFVIAAGLSYHAVRVGRLHQPQSPLPWGRGGVDRPR